MSRVEMPDMEEWITRLSVCFGKRENRKGSTEN